jgi:Ca2+-transporting ATPase
MSATEHRHGHRVRVAVKGAPEAVLAASSEVMTLDGPRPLDEHARRRWSDANERAAADGLRVIALAQKEAPVELDEEEVFCDLVLLGLVGLLDPPRSPVRAALEAARSAGVRVVMVTGDQPATATALARAVGLVEGPTQPLRGEDVPMDEGDSERIENALRAKVVARASPEQKLRLLSLHQDAGEVVAVLGDGVNDAPALRRADIGVAMGRRGTQVARQAADMVLEDDELSTVVLAIEQGRVIFSNLRAFVVYLLGCNLAEILSIGLAAAVGWPLPILPLQILYLNLFTDVFPAVALAVGEGDPAVMRRPPRARDEPFLTRRHWVAIVFHGVALTAAVLGGFGLARTTLALDDAAAVTVAFATLGFSQLWHVFDMADPAASPVRNDVTRNPWVWAAVALCTVAMIAGLLMPGLAPLLGAVPLPIEGWLLAIGLSLAPLALVQLARALRRMSASGTATHLV